MYRGCAATGRLFHQFDRETHRCKCGRWQAGFKPAKAYVMPRGECQVCERQQALNDRGVLGHHGYERPGHGWIVGDCFGVGHKPYTATSALELWHDAVANRIESLETRLQKLPAVKQLTYELKIYDRRLDGGSRVEQVVIVRGAAADYTRGVPSFESYLHTVTWQTTCALEQMNVELVRVAARIINAQQKVA